jgi:hypothetical protein
VDALSLSLVGRDRTYSTVLFVYGGRRVVAHVANGDDQTLVGVFTRQAIR